MIKTLDGWIPDFSFLLLFTLLFQILIPWKQKIRLMDYNNGFSISSFFLSLVSFLWIGAQFPQEKFLSYGRILTLDFYFLLMCILFSSIFYFVSNSDLLIGLHPMSWLAVTFTTQEINSLRQPAINSLLKEDRKERGIIKKKEWRMNRQLLQVSSRFHGWQSSVFSSQQIHSYSHSVLRQFLPYDPQALMKRLMVYERKRKG